MLCACFLAAALAVMPAIGSACRSARTAYSLMLSADVSELVVVGELVATESFNPYRGARVSHIRVGHAIYGEVATGDTLSVAWSTGRDIDENGNGTITTAPGPQLADFIGPHIWLLVRVNDELRSAGDPLTLDPTARSELQQYLEWARTARIPYVAGLSDLDVARRNGFDPERGDLVRRALAEYLEKCLNGLPSGG